MPSTAARPFAAIPSLDRLLQRDDVRAQISAHGRHLVTDCLRDEIVALRQRIARDGAGALSEDPARMLVERTRDAIDRWFAHSLRPVFNLTGTVLHTNLGRACLPEEAIAAVVAVARAPSSLELYNLRLILPVHGL